MTESQLLLLNNFVYQDEFTSMDNDKFTIREIFAKGVSNSAQQEMTPEEWNEIY